LVEGANQVLTFGKVHGDLATNTGIGLRQECRGELHEGKATQIDGGHKASQITDDAAPQGEDNGSAIATALCQAPAQITGNGKVFGRLAIGHNEQLDIPSTGTQGLADGGSMKWGDVVGGDQRGAAVGVGCVELVKALKYGTTDDYLIGVGAERNMDLGEGVQSTRAFSCGRRVQYTDKRHQCAVPFVGCY